MARLSLAAWLPVPALCLAVWACSSSPAPTPGPGPSVAAVPAPLLSASATAEPIASASALPSASASAAVVPPSTGKEMPKPKVEPLTKEKAKELVDDALAEAKKGDKADCAKVARNLARALPVAYGKDDKPFPKNAYYQMALCAETAGLYTLMRRATLTLLDGDPDFPHPGLLPKSALKMGQEDTAEIDLARMKKRYPKDPELPHVEYLLAVKKRDYNAALKAADAAVTLAGQATSTSDKAYTRIGEYDRANAYVHLGKVKEAEDALSRYALVGGEAKFSDRLRKLLVPIKATQALAEPAVPKETYLGIYHLYGKTRSHAVSVEVSNFGTKDRQFRIETEIPGITEKHSKVVTVLKGKVEAVQVTPQLLSKFDVTKFRAEQPVQVNLKITALGPDQLVIEEVLATDLMPRDYLPLAVRTGDQSKRVHEYSAAWVTPNAPGIDDFLREAKELLPKGKSFSGPQSATLPQVKALFEALKKRGVSYVMDPDTNADTHVAQRTRLPAEVLATTNAQCLEGTLLFATLFEGIGLEPILVFVPGHAFVGWRSFKDGKPDGTIVYLETTVVAGATFERAMEIAEGRVVREKPNFDRKIARVIDVTKLRKEGYSPQPL